MDSVTSLASVKDWGSGTFVAFIIIMMLTDRLIWRGRLTTAEKQRDEWQKLALNLLGVANRMTEVNEHAVQTIDQGLPKPETVEDIVSAAIRKVTEQSASDPKGGGLIDAARQAAQEAARRLGRESGGPPP